MTRNGRGGQPACPVCEVHAESVYRVEGMDCHEAKAVADAFDPRQINKMLE